MVARGLAVGLCLAALLAVCRADAAADLITDLPGLPSPAPFKQYAGYITVRARSDIAHVCGTGDRLCALVRPRGRLCRVRAAA